MARLNIHVTPSFEKTLVRLMKARRFRTKSEAVRVAVQEALQRAFPQLRSVDFRDWVGLGLEAPQNLNRRFQSEEELNPWPPT